MADCPGMVHLAAMADGGLARLRAPGGRLTAAQLRAVADAAERLGSGVVDLTSRANLQIRGLDAEAGPALVGLLEAAGFRFHGEADRRRNILVDPFSGLDPDEIRDLRPLGEALDRALVSAPWIAGLSPKFSFVLDGGGRSGVGAVASDVIATATADGIEIFAAGRPLDAFDETGAIAVLTALAEAAADRGPDARAKDIPDERLFEIAHEASDSLPTRGRREVAPRFGAVATTSAGRVALSIPVAVGRLDPDMLRFLARAAERDGDGHAVLAPWSGVVLPGVATRNANALLKRSEASGFTPIAVAARLGVVACVGAPACERAREPAKALGAAILDLAAREPDRLPKTPARLHLSACSKGCAGSATADLLLLGSSENPGWSLHRDAAPRRPGGAAGRLDEAGAAAVLALLALRG